MSCWFLLPADDEEDSDGDVSWASASLLWCLFLCLPCCPLTPLPVPLPLLLCWNIFFSDFVDVGSCCPPPDNCWCWLCWRMADMPMVGRLLVFVAAGPPPESLEPFCCCRITSWEEMSLCWADGSNAVCCDGLMFEAFLFFCLFFLRVSVNPAFCVALCCWCSWTVVYGLLLL